MGKILCNKCGQKTDSDMRSCSWCGSDLKPHKNSVLSEAASAWSNFQMAVVGSLFLVFAVYTGFDYLTTTKEEGHLRQVKAQQEAREAAFRQRKAREEREAKLVNEIMISGKQLTVSDAEELVTKYSGPKKFVRLWNVSLSEEVAKVLVKCNARLLLGMPTITQEVAEVLISSQHKNKYMVLISSWPDEWDAIDLLRSNGIRVSLPKPKNSDDDLSDIRDNAAASD